MNPWKAALLGSYYHTSLPYRRWWNQRARAQGRSPVMILFYHRVADRHPNDWTCPTRVFERQMDWLERRFDLVSLAEAQRRVASGRNERPAVSITFDDGYAENCRFALPLLIRRRIPCTYFVSTGFMQSGQPFPHDVACGVPLQPNSPAEIKQLAASGIEIGAHTRTHADLGRVHDAEQLREEVVEPGRELSQLIGRQVRYFAFPYGLPANLNPAAFALAREAGYEAVCSAYGGFNFPGDDSFHLQRIHGDPDLLRLKNWTTVDPRKLRTPRYDYQPQAQRPQPMETLLA